MLRRSVDAFYERRIGRKKNPGRKREEGEEAGGVGHAGNKNAGRDGGIDAQPIDDERDDDPDQRSHGLVYEHASGDYQAEQLVAEDQPDKKAGDGPQDHAVA